MEYREMVAYLKQSRQTLRKLGFTPSKVSIGEFAEAITNLNEVIDELNTPVRTGQNNYQRKEKK